MEGQVAAALPYEVLDGPKVHVWIQNLQRKFFKVGLLREEAHQKDVVSLL